MKLAKILTWCAGALFSLGVCTSAATAASSPGDPTLGKATLDLYWSDIKCGITTPQGTTYAVCNSPGFSALVQPGSYVFVTATLNYTYRDDGLPLVVIGNDGSPVIGSDGLPVRTYGVFQTSGMGGGLVVLNEAAGVILNSNVCNGRVMCGSPSETNSFDGPFLLTFGVNDQPDDLTGQYTFTATAGVRDNLPAPMGPEMRTARMGITNITVYSSVSPIPEPSTYGLMLAGLMGWGVMAQRRSIAAWARGWASRPQKDIRRHEGA
jgi:hypothetical protein